MWFSNPLKNVFKKSAYFCHLFANNILVHSAFFVTHIEFLKKKNFFLL
jgi:hypothetical protein